MYVQQVMSTQIAGPSEPLVKLCLVIYYRAFDVTNANRILDDWRDFLEFYLADEDYCMFQESSSKDFYSHYLPRYKNQKSPNSFTELLEKILVSPISSAEAERGFSILAHARTKRRSRLTPRHMDDILRIRCNGGRTLDLFPSYELAKSWAEKGHFLSDSHSKFAKSSIDSQSDDIEDEEKELEDEPGSHQKKFFDAWIFRPV